MFKSLVLWSVFHTITQEKPYDRSMAHCYGRGASVENRGVGCCVLEAVAGFLGVYFGVPVLDPADFGVHHVVVVVLEGYLGVLGAAHVLVTQGQHSLPLLKEI